MAGCLRVGVGCHAGGVTPVRAVLPDFYCTLVDLSEAVRSHRFDDFARRLGLPLGPGELYRRYTEMVTSEPGGRWRSWLCAVPDVVAGGGPPAARAVRRESAAGQFADAYADLRARAVIFPDVPDAVRALAATSGSQWSPTPIMTT